MGNQENEGSINIDLEALEAAARAAIPGLIRRLRAAEAENIELRKRPATVLSGDQIQDIESCIACLDEEGYIGSAVALRGIIDAAKEGAK